MTPSAFSRAIVIVIDSLGVGELPDAADYGDQGSNTLGNIAPPRAAADPGAARPRACRASPTCPAARRSRRPPAAFGRMAERSPGKDSVTGHWELMGLALDRAFPVFPNGFPEEIDPRSSSGASAAGRSGTPSRRAPSSSRSSAPSTCAPARRSCTRRRTASSRSPRTRTSSRCPSCTGSARSPTRCSSTGMGLGRVIARPFVGSAGVVPAARRTATTSPCRRPARRCSTALTAARRPGLRDRQDRGPVRRAGHHRVGAHRVGRRGHGPGGAGDGRAADGGLIFANLVDFDTVYGHRNNVDGLRAESRAVRRAALRAAAASAAGRPADPDGRPRQRPDDAEHRPLARVRAAAGLRRARAGRRRPRDAADVRRPRPDAGRRVRRRARWLTARASSTEIR